MAAAPPTIAKRWDTIGTVPPIETCLMIARTRFGSARHRGRIQVQGQDVDGDPSFPWARQDPITRAEAIDGLHQLRDACSNVQLRNRREAFRKAERFISLLPVRSAPLYRTFKNRSLPRGRDARVDIEVVKGMAFV